MKVLITYVSAGAGHRKAAEAVYDYLKNNRQDLDLKLVDALPFGSFYFRFCYNWGYPFLVHYAAWLWGFFFWATEFCVCRKVVRKCSSIINYSSCRKFVQYLKDENFDYIISTHFLNSELAANLKLKNKIKSKLITVITDFGVHPFWISEGTDTYIAASEFTRDGLLKEGVSESQVSVTGIPFNLNFNKAQDRHQLADRFGIAADKFTALIMTGSFGSGPLDKITKVLCNDVQVLVVCAENKELYNRLRRINYKDVKVFGFINNVEELMAVSDCIITKPGGSSIAELLAVGLVPIFITAIPGQEEHNAEILTEHGIGFRPKNIKQIRDLVIELKNNSQKLQVLKNNIKAIAKPFACREIADVIR